MILEFVNGFNIHNEIFKAKFEQAPILYSLMNLKDRFSIRMEDLLMTLQYIWIFVKHHLTF